MAKYTIVSAEPCPVMAINVLMSYLVGHCIDHIRQSLQCQGDMTPIPSTYFPSIRQNYVVTKQVHTCRKFEPIVKYTNARVNGSLLVGPELRGKRVSDQI